MNAQNYNPDRIMYVDFDILHQKKQSLDLHKVGLGSTYTLRK